MAQEEHQQENQDNREGMLTLTQAAEEAGLHSTNAIYYYLRKLKIIPKRYEMNRNAYITRAQAEEIKTIRASPWLHMRPKPHMPPKPKRRKPHPPEE